ncbi:MAG: hypothetical protein ABIR94_23890 [Rubrivivax sp.]
MDYRTLCLLVSANVCCGLTYAASIQHTCEFWNPRLGQMPEDFKYALDLETKRCSEEPCKITDDQLSWSTQGGRYSVTINRSTKDGQIMRESDLMTVLKNCRPVEAKP